MVGYLDQVSLRSIRGWAADQYGEPADLNASVNGKLMVSFRTSLERPDILSFARKDLGFDIYLEETLRPGDVLSVTDSSGNHLVGSPHVAADLQANKEDKALWLITRGMKILEIGPSFNPIAPRSRGWNSFSLDHATQEELRSKYDGQQPIDRIEPVDYVWKGGPIETAIPTSEHGSFDAVIASHVMEHIPDPIGFLQSAALLLQEHGLLSFVLPDKRVMFDFFKPLTVTSDYLLAHAQARSRHSKKTAFDNTAYNVSESHQIAWFQRAVGHFNFFGNTPVGDAKRLFDTTTDDHSGDYVDYHATVYTPSSFALIMFELRLLGMIPFGIAQRFPTSGCEFYVTLRKDLTPIQENELAAKERLQLMKQVIRELAEQAQWLDKDDQELISGNACEYEKVAH